MRPIILSIVAVAAVFATGASAATKAAHHRMHQPLVYDNPRPPLTVNKRSWLDPGPVVPEGSMEDYVTENTGFNKTPDQAYSPSRFGGEALPRPLYPIGRPEPVATFWTPPFPY